jgi:SRR1
MPHTSHKTKKKQRQHEQSASRNKRGEVESHDGWTQIARSHKAISAVSLTQQDAGHITMIPPDDPNYDQDQDEGSTQMTLVCRPAELPDGASMEKALGHYQRCNASWKQSRSCAELQKTLDSRIRKQDLEITNCICFGLSSPTGLISAGSSDRRDVAMYQLAAFRSVIDILTEQRGQRPEAFAQEPIFNTLDIALLAHLDIKVVEHPEAFNLITVHSFAFCPGAEQFVVRGTLSRSPAMYMGNSALETYLDPETGDPRSPNIGSIPLLVDHDDDHDKNSSSVQDQDADNKDRSGRDIKPHYRPHDIMAHKDSLPFFNERADVDAVRGARILHRFKEGKEVFRLPDLEAHNYALYNTHLFWRSSGNTEGLT